MGTIDALNRHPRYRLRAATAGTPAQRAARAAAAWRAEQWAEHDAQRAEALAHEDRRLAREPAERRAQRRWQGGLEEATMDAIAALMLADDDLSLR